MKKKSLKNKSGGVDKYLVYLIIILSVLGLLVLFDASAPVALSRFKDKYFFVRQQSFIFVVGFVVMAIFSKIHYKIFEKYSVVLYFMTLVLLLLVLIPSFGAKTLGARRWLDIGPLVFQPSEVVKLTLSMYIAKVASSNKSLISYLLPFGLAVVLIMLQPDLGTSVIISLIALSQIYISGVNMLQVVGISIFGLVSGGFLILMSPYRKARLLTYLEMSRDPLGASYHIRQVLYSLGMGGFWGVGLGQSRQKYLYLPEVSTDSIFAVIAEEAGFIGSAFVILLFTLLIFKGVSIVKNSPDKYSQVLSCGIIVWIAGQAFLNFSSMLAIFPLTGVPLPFFSAGGSSLLTMFAGLGILLNISRYAEK